MSSEWIPATIGDFCAFQYGKNLPQRNRKTGAIPVISSAGVVGTHDTPYVKKPGVVIGRKGTVGSITLSSEPFWPIDTAFFVEDEPQLRDIRFVYYLLKTLGLESMNTDSAVPGLNRNNAHAIPILVPPLAIQKQIADLLQNLDDRITLLRETNKTLESIAQAIFKSWFVDFDPVRAKMEGRQPKGMDEATAALFPDSLTKSALGLIPSGWSVQPFLDTVNVIGGGTPKTSVPEYWGGEIPWFSVADAPSTSDIWVLNTEKQITEKGLNESSTKLLPAGTTIISARGTVGKLALTGKIMAMNQSCYGLRGKSNDTYFTFLNTSKLVDTLKQHSHGSVFDTITRATLNKVQVPYPAHVQIISGFEALVAPVMEKVRANVETMRLLASLRDTLLPRLISGKLRLPELQEATALAQP